MFTRGVLLALATALELTRAHTVITYPRWRGNNLITNGSYPHVSPDSIGVDYSNGSVTFPFGMQYTFPCGGMPVTTNRTKWPVGGGAISIAPGAGPGFKTSFIYVNLGITSYGDLAPLNYSHPVVPPIAISGTNASTWPGQMCIPQVGMPAGMQFNSGDNITLQVVQVGPGGEAVYSCSDVTLAPNGDPSIDLVTPQSCYNSTDIAISQVFTTAALTSGSAQSLPRPFTSFAVLAISFVSAAYVLL